MRTRRRRCFAATALGIAIVAGILVDEAAARRRPTSSFVARIKGRRCKPPGRLVFAGYAFGPTLGLFDIGSATKPHLRIGPLIRSLGVGCLTTDLTAATFPVTFTGSGNYHEMKLGHPELTRSWTTDMGMQITIDSFDGTRVRGTVTGTLETPSNPGDPPVTLENGRFNVILTLNHPGG